MMVRGWSPPAASSRGGSVRSMPATDFLSARICSSLVFVSRAWVMAFLALLSAAPNAGLSSFATSFIPADAEASVPFFPKNATRASSSERSSLAAFMPATASFWMDWILSVILLQGEKGGFISCRRLLG